MAQLYMHVIIESAIDERITSSIPQPLAQDIADNWEAKGYGASIVPCSCPEACANLAEFHLDDVVTVKV